jgi:hypothetical protein
MDQTAKTTPQTDKDSAPTERAISALAMAHASPSPARR